MFYKNLIYYYLRKNPSRLWSGQALRPLGKGELGAFGLTGTF